MGECGFAFLELFFGITIGIVVGIGTIATAAFLAVRELNAPKKEKPVGRTPDADHSNN